jgi:hypothetical protein
MENRVLVGAFRHFVGATVDLTLAEIALIEGVIAWNDGTQDKLIATHLYRFSPPRNNRYLKRRTRTIVSLAGAAGTGGSTPKSFEYTSIGNISSNNITSECTHITII